MNDQQARRQIHTMCASLKLSIVGMECSGKPFSPAEQIFVAGYRKLHGQLVKALNRGMVHQVALEPVQLPLLRASLTGSLNYVREYSHELADVPELREPLTPERLEATLAQVNAWIAHPPVPA